MAGNVVDIAPLTITNIERDTILQIVAKINALITIIDAQAEAIYTLQNP